MTDSLCVLFPFLKLVLPFFFQPFIYFVYSLTLFTIQTLDNALLIVMFCKPIPKHGNTGGIPYTAHGAQITPSPLFLIFVYFLFLYLFHVRLDLVRLGLVRALQG